MILKRRDVKRSRKQYEYSGSVFTCNFDICQICFTGQFAEMMKKEFGAEMECN